MEKVSWGILSTANIGVTKVIPAMQQSKLCSIDAIGSRNIANAEKVAKKLGIPKTYGSYEELLADDSITAIYNPLPNHLHVHWTIKALEAGKHVLCEKPIGLNATDAQKLYDAAKKFPKLKVMEAFMYRYHPQWIQVKKWISEGKIGDLKAIQSIFVYHNIDPKNVRNQADIGGGGLLDIGCYNISFSRFITGREPIRVSSDVDRDPVMKTDRAVSAIMDFGDINSSFISSTQMAPHQNANIIGNKGRIFMELPFNAPSEEGAVIHLHNEDGIETVTTVAVDQYSLQGDMFSRAILDDTPVATPLGDAVNNMKVIDAIFKAGDVNGWVEV